MIFFFLKLNKESLRRLSCVKTTCPFSVFGLEMSEEATRGTSEAPEAGNSEALEGLDRSWTEKVKSKFGGRRQRTWGALRERGLGEGVVREKGVFGYRWESLGF